MSLTLCTIAAAEDQAACFDLLSQVCDTALQLTTSRARSVVLFSHRVQRSRHPNARPLNRPSSALGVG